MAPAPGRFGRQFWQVVLIGMLTSVAVVLLHELGHYLPAWLFDFPGTTLHYGNVTSATDAAMEGWVRQGDLVRVAAIHPLEQLWWVAAGGPIASLIITAGCAIGIVRWYHPAWFVAGLQAETARVLTAGSLVLTGKGGGDEFSVAFYKGWPPTVVGGVELALTVSTVAGFVIWFGYLGPVLLP